MVKGKDINGIQFERNSRKICSRRIFRRSNKNNHSISDVLSTNENKVQEILWLEGKVEVVNSQHSRLLSLVQKNPMKEASRNCRKGVKAHLACGKSCPGCIRRCLYGREFLSFSDALSATSKYYGRLWLGFGTWKIRKTLAAYPTAV